MTCNKSLGVTSFTKKIRGLKRKFKGALRDYNYTINNFDGYAELYVPQITYKDEVVTSYTISNFLIENTINNIPNDAYYLYVFDETFPLNNHLIIADDEEDLEFGLLKSTDENKPMFIKQLEDRYNLQFERYLATWEMDETTYFNLDYEEKKSILYIEHDGDNVIAVTNTLLLCKGD
ncbi:hypothetical protein [Mammaliicoccus sciuri]|uniref:hypothetical protein n=1 Tax=Mammaliicoccus sciuri TaxID=1296 RepID=UPI001D16F4CD|nr:hypothetical protein [Mammaliicoccus sciuri]